MWLQSIPAKSKTYQSVLFANVDIYSLQYLAFSKNHKLEDDLYGKILAPYFQEDLLVQSWRNGAGEKLDSDCKPKYQSMNIAHIRL